ncbi:MAG: caspase family protein [Cytophagaceae bacterium]|nr:caspase family protein [Cytophagaceae bacterium]
MRLLRQLVMYSVWAVFVAFQFAVTPTLAQTKHALIIAIGDYPNGTGTNKGTTDWPDINSANDVPLIRESLRKQGFTDIVVLRDTQATRNGILAALDALKERCQKGDIVVIHFSSHGQQIDDNNNDELDALDEAIVCYGAPDDAAGRFANYDGSQHLRDEDLGQQIDQIRVRLEASGDVLLIADACHSGTIMRGNGGSFLVRGNKSPMHLAGYKNRTGSRVAQKPRPFLGSTNTQSTSQTGMASYVVISAARADEANQECITAAKQPAGSLSYAFSRAMANLRPGETYRLLFNQIVTELQRMEKSQHPEVEGTVDRQLFGGQIVDQKSYYAISTLAETRLQLTIAAGQLEMIYPGTTVSICPAGTKNPATATQAVSGTVTASTLFATTINLAKPLPAGLESEYWVFLRERAFGDLTVRVSLDSLKHPASLQQIKGALTNLPLVKFDQQEPDLLICQRDSAGFVQVVVRRTSDGTVYGNPIRMYTQEGAEKVSTRIQDYVQAKFLQNFNPSYPDIDVRMELLPNKAQSQNANDTTSREPFMQNGLLAVPPGWVSVRVTNVGKHPAYFSIIDIQPDGIVSVVFPRPKSDDSPNDYRIESGKSFIIPSRVKISPPYGSETFKLLASLEKFDLRNVIKMRERGDSEVRGVTNVLEKVFGRAQVVARTRGGEGESGFPETTIGSFSYPFLIVPAKR